MSGQITNIGQSWGGGQTEFIGQFMGSYLREAGAAGCRLLSGCRQICTHIHKFCAHVEPTHNTSSTYKTVHTPYLEDDTPGVGCTSLTVAQRRRQRSHSNSVLSD